MDSSIAKEFHKAQRRLAGLAEDPLQLDQERQRFNRTPPPHTPYPSALTTLSMSPRALNREQLRRQERRIKLGLEAEASTPSEQFSAQIEEERRRIWVADPGANWINIYGGDTTFREQAREIVKNRWVEQGIWNNKWNVFAFGRWKHEEPLELEPEPKLKVDIEVEPSNPIFSFFGMGAQPRLNPSKIEDERQRQFEERRAVREREREASRPYYQFLYQVSKERERVEAERGEEIDPIRNINTIAYDNVKRTWVKRKIWNLKWGTLPGMSWKHEEPIEDEEEPAGTLTPTPNHPFGYPFGFHHYETNHHVREETPLSVAHRHPFGCLSPARPYHNQAFNNMNNSTSEQEINGMNTPNTPRLVQGPFEGASNGVNTPQPVQRAPQGLFNGASNVQRTFDSASNSMNARTTEQGAMNLSVQHASNGASNGMNARTTVQSAMSAPVQRVASAPQMGLARLPVPYMRSLSATPSLNSPSGVRSKSSSAARGVAKRAARGRARK
jgi:hypothetical protein